MRHQSREALTAHSSTVVRSLCERSVPGLQRGREGEGERGGEAESTAQRRLVGIALNTPRPGDNISTGRTPLPHETTAANTTRGPSPAHGFGAGRAVSSRSIGGEGEGVRGGGAIVQSRSESHVKTGLLAVCIITPLILHPSDASLPKDVRSHSAKWT